MFQNDQWNTFLKNTTKNKLGQIKRKMSKFFIWELHGLRSDSCGEFPATSYQECDKKLALLHCCESLGTTFTDVFALQTVCF